MEELRQEASLNAYSRSNLAEGLVAISVFGTLAQLTTRVGHSALRHLADRALHREAVACVDEPDPG